MYEALGTETSSADSDDLQHVAPPTEVISPAPVAASAVVAEPSASDVVVDPAEAV